MVTFSLNSPSRLRSFAMQVFTFAWGLKQQLSTDCTCDTAGNHLREHHLVADTAPDIALTGRNSRQEEKGWTLSHEEKEEGVLSGMEDGDPARLPSSAAQSHRTDCRQREACEDILPCPKYVGQYRPTGAVQKSSMLWIPHVPGLLGVLDPS